MKLYAVLFMLSWAAVNSKVYWIVANKPVMYEHDIILTCKTGHVLTDRVKCPVRKWRGGHKNKILLYNKVSRDVTKYEDRTNMSSTNFSLVIRNYTESDLNINYTCSCGFKLKSYTKFLGLNDKDFIVPPLRVETRIQQSNETLSIYLHVERVYPRPEECSIVIGERTVKENVTSVKRDTFFSATCEASLNIVDDDCGKKPTLLCYIGNKYIIANISGKSMLNCTAEVRDDGGNTTRYNSTSTEAYSADMFTVALGVFLVFIIGCLSVLVFKFYASKHIQKRKRTDDIIDSGGDLKNEMLAVNSKIHKQNDNEVELTKLYL